MNCYANLSQIRAYLESSDTAMSTDDDAKLTQYLIWASRQIDRRTHRKFYPRIETREYDYQGDAREHLVDDDLLAITTLTVDGSSVASSEYYLYPLTGYPKFKIEMNRGGGTIFTYSDTPQSAVSLAGTWGYHEDWDNAWVDSQDTVEDDPLSDSATSLTVNNIDGADINGITPRISVGSLLKIENEYLEVTAVNTTTNVATVLRGRNGSTASAHVQDTTISVFLPFAPAITATLDLVKWIYEHRSAVGGIIALPSLEGAAIEVEVDKILAAHSLPVRAADLIGF